MKRLITLLTILATICLYNHAADYSIFGFKGQVESATIVSDYDDTSYRIVFDSNGKVTSLGYESPFYNQGVNFGGNPTVTSTAISGLGMTASLSKGHIGSIKISDVGSSYVMQYFYDSAGQLSKITSSFSWSTTSQERISGTAAMNQAVQRANQLRNELAKLKPGTAAYNAKLQEYNKAAAAANINSTASTVVTRTQNHSGKGPTKTFSNYKFDEFGNWVQRTVSFNSDYDSFSYTEVQRIVYAPEFISEKRWEAIANRGYNLDEIETFYNLSETTPVYKNKAKIYWNEHVLDHNFINSPINTLIAYGEKDICSKQNSETMLEQARKKEWEAVLSKGGRLDDVEAFYNRSSTTQAYKDKARHHWNMNVLGTLFEQGDPNKMIAYAQKPICSADNSGSLMDNARRLLYSNEVLTERNFKRLKNLADMQRGGVQVFNSQYRDLIMARSDSMYTDSIAYLERRINDMLSTNNNKEAMRVAKKALEIAPENKTFLGTQAQAEYNILALQRKSDNKPSSDDYWKYLNDNPGSPHTEQVNKWHDKQVNAENRGSFVHIGVAMDAAYGGPMSELGGGLGMRLGWLYQVLNVYAGVQFNGVGRYENQDNAYDGHFSGAVLTMPAMLRINLSRSYDFATYFGAGANINIPINGWLAVDRHNGGNAGYHVSDKNFFKDKLYFVPRIALGVSGEGVEFEVYGTYNTGEILNRNLLMSYDTPENSLDIETLDKQIKQKFTVGIAFRLLF